MKPRISIRKLSRSSPQKWTRNTSRLPWKSAPQPAPASQAAATAPHHTPRNRASRTRRVASATPIATSGGSSVAELPGVHGRALPHPAAGNHRKGMISSATTFTSLSIGLMAGPAVSL